jgi:putative endonuclease
MYKRALRNFLNRFSNKPAVATVPSVDGAAAEQRAARYLERHGLVLLARNYRSPYGELDLVMQQREMVVFVEVRFRRRSQYGSPAETVDARKQARLRATAEHFLQHDRRASNRPCRFDIVAILSGPEGERFEWLRDAF